MDKLAPQVHDEGWSKVCKVVNKVIFEDPNCSFCGVTVVIVRGHKLEYEGVILGELL